MNRVEIQRMFKLRKFFQNYVIQHFGKSLPLPLFKRQSNSGNDRVIQMYLFVNNHVLKEKTLLLV